MSTASRIQNVLIVLSPLSLAFMQADAAVGAALDLKEKGAMRADLMVDPRLHLQPSRHLSTYPVPDFTQAARNLSCNIFGPVLGNSDIQDFSDAVGKYYNRVMPDLFSLSHIGSLFTSTKHDGGHLGLALYTALHGKSSDGKDYTHLLYPDMSPHARRILSIKLGGECLGGDEEKASYGVSVNLKSVRERIKTLASAGAMQPTHRPQ